MNRPFQDSTSTGKRVIKAIIFFLIGFSITVYDATGQERSSAELDKIIARMDSLAKAASAQTMLSNNTAKLSEIEMLLTYGRSAAAPGIEVLEVRENQLKRDKGLSFEAGYLENFEQGVFGAEGIYYDRRMQMGLKWDVLKNGWLANFWDARQLKREQQILQVQHKQDQYQKQERLLEQRIDYLFNRRQIAHLTNYLNATSAQLDQLRQLYDMGYQSWDEVLNVIGRRAELTSQLKALSSQQQLIQVPTEGLPERLPVLELNTQSVERELRQNPDQAKIDSLRLANIRSETNSWQDISISANLRYNYYSDQTTQFLLSETGDREYFSVGVNVSVPFTVFQKGRGSLEQAYRSNFDYKNDEQVQHSLATLRSLISDYQQLLNDYTRQYNRHDLQTEQVLNIDFDGYIDGPASTPATILSRLIKQFEIKHQLIETKRKLYQKLRQISVLVPELPLSAYARLRAKPDLLEDENLASDVYIWSDTFKAYPNSLLLQFLSSRSYQKVLLSPANTDAGKIAHFIEEAQPLGLEVHLMKGSNVLVRQEKWGQIDSLCVLAEKVGAKGIHLDVEPHTFEDWDQRRDQYLTEFTAMIREARKVTTNGGLELSVSVPVFYDSIMTNLAPLVDGIYVMAYGSNDLLKVIERIAGEYSITKLNEGQMKIVLRPDDFAKPGEMQAFMKAINQQLGSTEFAVHDLRRVINPMNKGE